MFKEKIDYRNAYATFIDAHTLELKDEKGEIKKVTSENILISVGLRP